MSRQKRSLTAPAIAALAAALALASACGRKVDPQPADLVQPKAVADLTAEVSPQAVHLVWNRPNVYVNGRRMDDLGGFIVFRGVPGARAEQIGTIEVLDRDRLRPETRYEFFDDKAAKGKLYYYRIVSYTTDKYYSPPSNQVVVQTQP